MAKSQQTFNKIEKEKKRLKKREIKEKKKAGEITSYNVRPIKFHTRSDLDQFIKKNSAYWLKASKGRRNEIIQQVTRNMAYGVSAGEHTLNDLTDFINKHPLYD